MAESDEELIRDALAGDQRAYRELLNRHRQPIYHVIFKIIRNPDEAADLVQETFMKAFGSLSSYRFEYRFSTWLYKIAANNAIDYLRKKRIDALSLDKPIETHDGEVTYEVPDWSTNPEQDLIRRRQAVTISEAIESLPPKYREVIQLRHNQDKSYEEIAEQLNLPVGTVKARIFRARELLKKKLKSIWH
ncbi:MAG: sigma-70 family RNA polymerase sigma factor [candidate division Zixibacteria bacterium]|nr:sigma-70 family RNA polymerase sigma factor [candidate division Zixibacteria bacterium]